MNMRKMAATLMAGGLLLSLLGSGVGASFTDTATAGMTIHVGTFGIQLSASGPGITVSPDNHTVTFAPDTIQGSGAGSLPFNFTVTSTGTIPALISVSATTPASPFVDLLGSVTPFTLTQGQTHTFNAGLSWPELTNSQLGMSTGITYTISATA